LRRYAVMALVFCMVLATFVPSAFSAQTEDVAKSASTALSAPAADDQLLVQFAPGTARADRAQVAAAHGGKVVDRIEALDIEVFSFPGLKANSKAMEQMMAALKKNKNVIMVEQNLIYTVNFTPNDPSQGSQWAWGVIDAYQGWDVTQGSTSTVIAVVDTGVQRNHPDLDAKIVAGYDYVQNDTAPDDGNGHGTHVAGTAAAETNNSTGGAGTCPNCKVMPVRVLDNNGSGTLANVANGITWAANNGAKVINLSLGGGGSSTLQQAVQYAWSKGVFLACAAGNSNTSSTSSAYPAAYAECFGVASTTSTDARSSFSNYGSWVEVAAPGSSIYSTWLNSGYNTINGTSMATPHVAGLAGLLASQGKTNQQIWDTICNSAEDISGTGTYWTCGRINVNNAVGGGTTPPPPPPPPPAGALQNGGFESGIAPWVETSTGGYTLRDTARPHTGSYSEWMGGYNSGTDTVSQTVVVPSNGTLSYWWYMTSSESTSTAYDYMRVKVYNASTGALLATLRTRSNTAARNAWYQDSISMAAYAGQTVKITFEVTTDSSVTTSFFIDDVSL
jgi:thermitase